MKKTILALALAGVLLIGGSVTAYAVDYTDITGHWAETTIRQLVADKIVTGYADGTVRPDEPITRAEFSVLLARQLSLPTQSTTMAFDDVPESHWAASEIGSLTDENIIDKVYYGNTFLPNTSINRMEIVDMLLNSLPNTIREKAKGKTAAFNDLNTMTAVQQEKLNAAIALNLVTGYNDQTMRPQATATRAEAFTFLARSLELLREEENKKQHTTKLQPIPNKPTSSSGGHSNGGSHSSGDGSSTNSPDPAPILEMPEKAYIKTDVNIALPKTEGSAVTWKVERNGEPISLSNWGYELNETGGTIQFFEIGNYTVTATITKGKQKETVVSKTITIYPSTYLSIHSQDTSTTQQQVYIWPDTNLDTDLTWTLRENPEKWNQVIQGNLGNQGGYITFLVPGTYTLVATGVDPLDQEIRAEKTINVSKKRQTLEITPSRYSAIIGDTIEITTNQPEDVTEVVWHVTATKPGTADILVDNDLTDFTLNGGTYTLRHEATPDNSMDTYIYTFTVNYTYSDGHSAKATQDITLYPAPRYCMPAKVSHVIGGLTQLDSTPYIPIDFTPGEWLIYDEDDTPLKWEDYAEDVNIEGGLISFKITKPGTYKIYTTITDEGSGRTYPMDGYVGLEVHLPYSFNLNIDHARVGETVYFISQYPYDIEDQLVWTITATTVEENGEEVTQTFDFPPAGSSYFKFTEELFDPAKEYDCVIKAHYGPGESDYYSQEIYITSLND